MTNLNVNFNYCHGNPCNGQYGIVDLDDHDVMTLTRTGFPAGNDAIKTVSFFHDAFWSSVEIDGPGNFDIFVDPESINKVGSESPLALHSYIAFRSWLAR